MTSDPCDRCCAHPHVKWTRDGAPQPLLMCAHHSREHGPSLAANGWVARTLIDPASDTRPGGPLTTAAS